MSTISGNHHLTPSEDRGSALSLLALAGHTDVPTPFIPIDPATKRPDFDNFRQPGATNLKSFLDRVKKGEAATETDNQQLAVSIEKTAGRWRCYAEFSMLMSGDDLGVREPATVAISPSSFLAKFVILDADKYKGVDIDKLDDATRARAAVLLVSATSRAAGRWRTPGGWHALFSAGSPEGRALLRTWEHDGLSGEIVSPRHYFKIHSPTQLLEAVEALDHDKHRLPAWAFRPKPIRVKRSAVPPHAQQDDRRAKYCARAVEGQLREIANPRGSRHDTLRDRVRAIAGWCAAVNFAPGFTANEIRLVARKAYLSNFTGSGRAPDDFEPTFDAAWTDGAARPLEPRDGWTDSPEWLPSAQVPEEVKPAPKTTDKPKGKPTITRDSTGLAQALHHLELRFRYNNRSAQIEIQSTQPGSPWQEVEDEQEADLKERIADNCLFPSNNPESQSQGRARFGEVTWKRSILALSYRTATDPFLDWLKSLPPWDGVERIDHFITDIFDVPKDIARKLTAWTGQHIFMGPITRTLDPGHKLDVMPVLIGPQSIGKSTTIAMVFPDDERHAWFSDNLNFSEPDIRKVEALLGSVIVEAAEMAGATRAEIERLKAFLSRTNDKCRLAYGRRKTQLPRRCIFVGTANNESCIPNDPTGNRRFVSIPVYAKHDLKTLRNTLDENRDQLWAEALHRVRDLREPVWLTPDLEAAAAPINARFRNANAVVEDALDRWLEKRTEPFILSDAIRGINEVLDGEPLPDENHRTPDRIRYDSKGQDMVKTALQIRGYSLPKGRTTVNGKQGRYYYPKTA